jgi:hypothetical protein
MNRTTRDLFTIKGLIESYGDMNAAMAIVDQWIQEAKKTGQKTYLKDWQRVAKLMAEMSR